jgi:hypothetical protein
MAFSFCCAPLHAARIVLRNSRKVPDSSENQTPQNGPFSRMVDANLEVDVTPPAALGGYPPWGCQVAGKVCGKGRNAQDTLTLIGPPMVRQPQQNAPFAGA